MSIQVKPLLDRVSANTFVDKYLQARGVENVDEYLFPTSSCYDSPFAYPNMMRAVECLKNAVDRGTKVGVLVD